MTRTEEIQIRLELNRLRRSRGNEELHYKRILENPPVHAISSVWGADDHNDYLYSIGDSIENITRQIEEMALLLDPSRK